MADVIICSAAEEDFTNSLCWYADRSVDAALAFDAEFDRSLKRIVESPEMYPKCDARHHFFFMKRFPFQIIYRIDGDIIMIIAVAHLSRAPDYWHSR